MCATWSKIVYADVGARAVGWYHKTFECARRRNSVQGIIVDGDDILLPYELQPGMQEPAYGLWGGVLEDEESPMDAMHRELLEEAGMRGTLSPWMTLSKGGYIERDEIFFIITDPVVVQKPQLDPGGEDVQLMRVSFPDFIEIIATAGFRNSNFANYILKTYVYPHKQEELWALLKGHARV